MPVAYIYIIISKCTLAEGQCNLFFLTGFQEHFCKRTELFFRAENRAFLIGNINLCNFSTVHTACIFNLKRNINRFAVFNFSSRKLHIAVFKCGIRKAVSKREKHILFCCIIITVANINAFLMLRYNRFAGIISVNRIITE